MVEFLNSDGDRTGLKTIIVLGCGRGGTSAIAGVLRELGVMFPEATHPLKHESSPVRYAQDRVDRQETQFAFSTMDSCGKSWGWKSPRDIYTFSDWISFVRNPHFVIIFRNFVDIMESVLRHENVGFSLAGAHIGDVHAELGRFITFMPYPLAIVSYERLCSSPNSIVHDISNWLELKPTSLQARNAAEFVSGDKRGYRRLVEETSVEPAGFSQSDIAMDQTRSQAAIYRLVSDELRQRTIALDNDIQKATIIVEHLSAEVTKLSRKLAFCRADTKDPELLDGQPQNIEGLLNEVRPDFLSDPEDPADVSFPTEIARAAAELAYRQSWSDLSSVFLKRVSLQRQIDGLLFRRDRLVKGFELDSKLRSRLVAPGDSADQQETLGQHDRVQPRKTRGLPRASADEG